MTSDDVCDAPESCDKVGLPSQAVTKLAYLRIVVGLARSQDSKLHFCAASVFASLAVSQHVLRNVATVLLLEELHRPCTVATRQVMRMIASSMFKTAPESMCVLKPHPNQCACWGGGDCPGARLIVGQLWHSC